MGICASAAKRASKSTAWGLLMASAIIPARGGSKSLPRKNLRPIAGLPLVAHTISAALRAQSIERVYVSTDDPEIADVSRQFGAEVVQRPAELAADKASSEAALIHAIGVMDSTFHDRPEIIVFLQCTTPFTTPEHIDGLIAALDREHADCAFTVHRTHAFLWTIDAAGAPVGVNHDLTQRPRRQDRRPEFIETGAGYALRRDGFLAARHRFFGRIVMFETPDAPPFELDDAADFERVEALMMARPPALNRPLPTKLDLVIFDFDGVMTDDRVFVDETGREAVSCSRGDGLGIERLRKAGIPMLVLSKEENAVVRARCRKLGVESFYGIDDKLTLLRRLCGERQLSLANCIYMGNDINDLACMAVVGFAVAPLDARPEVHAKADLVVTAPGGRGAVRALCDRLLGHYAKSAIS